jgi:hypothetical protein
MRKISEKLKEEVIRTNPVWSVEKTIKQWSGELYHDPGLIRQRLDNAVVALHGKGVTLPREFLNAKAAAGLLSADKSVLGAVAKRRVCGLTVIPESQDSLIVPLNTLPWREWKTSPLLPFDQWQIRSLLLSLLMSSDFDQQLGVPERFAFYLSDFLERDTKGDSMTIAGLLSVIDAQNGHKNPLFESSVAVVQPTKENGLSKVRFVREKLEAFHRECRMGGLLVRHPDCIESECYMQYFANTASVQNLSELAAFLFKKRVLNCFVNTQPLSYRDTTSVVASLTRYNQEYQQDRILDLACRTERCGYQVGVPNRLRVEVRWAIANAARHTGDMVFAKEYAAKVQETLLQCQDTTSYTELVLAAARLAAALYDLHDFQNAESLLKSWFEKVHLDPKIVSMEARVELYNTYGRVASMLKRLDWEAHFKRTLSMQSEADLGSLSRTRNYLIGESIRHSLLENAESLVNLQLEEAFDPGSNTFLPFYRASIARKQNNRWADSDVDQIRPERFSHPFGLYHQAVARQVGVCGEEYIARMLTARELLLNDIQKGSHNNILPFLADALQLAINSKKNNIRDFDHTRDSLQRFLKQDGLEAMHSYYSAALASLAFNNVEPFLTEIPYF